MDESVLTTNKAGCDVTRAERYEQKALEESLLELILSKSTESSPPHDELLNRETRAAPFSTNPT